MRFYPLYQMIVRALLPTVVLFAWIVFPYLPTQAQDPSPTPTAGNRLYLPLIQQRTEATKTSPPSRGHGEWPVGRSYTVRAEDTLLTVALEMGMDLEQINCLIDSNFRWEQPLVIGDVLTVPETPFTCHTVEDDQSLPNIAGLYGVTIDQIRAETWNRLDGDPMAGQNLRIPVPFTTDTARGGLVLGGGWGGELETRSVIPGPRPALSLEDNLPADWPYGSGAFAWPAYGWITQGFRTGHSAIDIGAFAGTPVTAADRGVVLRAGWSNVGYGQFVVIDHNIDYITLYAHLSDIYVEEGQVVAKGQLIGRVGSTGNSTGPHLHFEIRDFGTRVDPLRILPR
ncbi:peptidoglycan DD-metalloendopeptidase family protein [bacterium]|nr:peptidoglycan DD-metalloendopeptidase family protein [bacterium]